jgi:hypothetical protein
MNISKKRYYYLITILLVFFLLESFVRLAISTDAYFEKISSNHSSYRRLAWIRNHSEDSVDELSSIHQFDSILGWKYKSNLSSFKYMNNSNKVLSTNNEGYRGLNEFDTSGIRPVLMLGDSFTFGEEVSDNETYTYLLGKKYQKERIFNLGVNAYGYDQMLLTLKRYIALYKPKTIILSYNFVDLDRALLSFHDYFKPYYSLNNGKLFLNTDHIYSPKAALSNEKYNLKFIDLLNILNAKYFLNVEEYRKQRLEINEKIFQEMLRVSKENDAKLVFYFLPIAWEANDLRPELLRSERTMFEFCEKLLIECYSSRSEFIKYAQDTGNKMKETGHWTEEGHKAVFRSMSKLFEN